MKEPHRHRLLFPTTLALLAALLATACGCDKDETAEAEPVAFEALSGALGDTSAEVRYNAAWALGRIGNPSALPAMLPLLDDPDAIVREFAAEALSVLTKSRVRDIRDPRKRADYMKTLRTALKIPEPIPKAANAPSSQ